MGYEVGYGDTALMVTTTRGRARIPTVVAPCARAAGPRSRGCRPISPIEAPPRLSYPRRLASVETFTGMAREGDWVHGGHHPPSGDRSRASAEPRPLPFGLRGRRVAGYPAGGGVLDSSRRMAPLTPRWSARRASCAASSIWRRGHGGRSLSLPTTRLGGEPIEPRLIAAARVRHGTHGHACPTSPELLAGRMAFEPLGRHAPEGWSSAGGLPGGSSSRWRGAPRARRRALPEAIDLRLLPALPLVRRLCGG